ncbi:MAG: hypothetical protein ACPGEF_04520 [Endozoicomonas sp.]
MTDKGFIRSLVEKAVITGVCTFEVALIGAAVGFVWNQAITASDEREGMSVVFSEKLDGINVAVIEIGEVVAELSKYHAQSDSKPTSNVREYVEEQRMAPNVQQSLQEYYKRK